MKKLSLIVLLLAASPSVQAQDNSKSPTKPQILIQETPQKLQEQAIANTPIQASQTRRLPYVLNAQPFFGNQVVVSVPSTFISADDALIKSQYPDADNLPKVVLTDNTKRPLLALNLSRNAGDREDIVHFFRDVKNDIRTKYPTSRFLKTDVVRNRTLAIIEVVLPNKDGQSLYNMMAFRYVGEKFFFLNFSCPEEDMNLWQNTAREIAENVKINSN